MGSLPVCRRCSEPLRVVRSPSLVGTMVSHRNWTTEVQDAVVRENRDTFASAVRAWMEGEHHEAAFLLCGEIKGLWEDWDKDVDIPSAVSCLRQIGHGDGHA